MRWPLKILLLAMMAVWSAVFVLPDNKLHVVVCDVGQGDAILISQGTTQMLVDGGPDSKVLDCLAKHMPFYDKRIEVVVMTHPQADHLNGLIDVAKRYRVLQFVREPVSNNTFGYRELVNITKDIKTSSVYSGDKVLLGNKGVTFLVIWPTKEFVTKHIVNTTLPGPPPKLGGGGRGVVLAGVSDGTDLNSFGIVGKVSFGDFDALLTADADARVELAEIGTGLLSEVEILKVPHHGSKTGMLSEWLRLVNPKLAVISVGKNNKYRHPSDQALQMLAKYTKNVYRTDQNGSVEIISDGRTYKIKLLK